MNKYISNELIEHAHSLRKELNMSYQEIVDGCEDIGFHTPMSTVRRFFDKDATQHKFSTSTVQGIIAVLGDTHNKTKGMTAPESVDFLKEIIAYKNDIIADLERQLKENEQEIIRIKEKHTSRIIEIATDNQRRIDFVKDQLGEFKDQISIKDRRMDEREAFFIAQINLKDRRFDNLNEKYEKLLDEYIKLKG